MGILCCHDHFSIWKWWGGGAQHQWNSSFTYPWQDNCIHVFARCWIQSRSAFVMPPHIFHYACAGRPRANSCSVPCRAAVCMWLPCHKLNKDEISMGWTVPWPSHGEHNYQNRQYLDLSKSEDSPYLCKAQHLFLGGGLRLASFIMLPLSWCIWRLISWHSFLSNFYLTC